MNTPGFTAEMSLCKKGEHYRMVGTPVSLDWGANGAKVTPALHQAKYHYRVQHATTHGLSTEVEPAIIRFGNVSICSGDDDCNGMFLTGCTGSYARCWVRGPDDGSVFCMCSN